MVLVGTEEKSCASKCSPPSLCFQPGVREVRLQGAQQTWKSKTPLSPQHLEAINYTKALADITIIFPHHFLNKMQTLKIASRSFITVDEVNLSRV